MLSAGFDSTSRVIFGLGADARLWVASRLRPSLQKSSTTKDKKVHEGFRLQIFLLVTSCPLWFKPLSSATRLATGGDGFASGLGGSRRFLLAFHFGKTLLQCRHQIDHGRHLL